jgi:CRISPR-associated protein Csx1
LSILVVSIWGFPGNWVPVRYRVAVPPGDCAKWGKLSSWSLGNRTVTSHVTGFAVARSLEERIGSVRVAVYGLDALAASSPPNMQKISPKDSVRAECVKELKVFLEEVMRQGPPRNYREVVECASRVLNIFLSRYAEEAGIEGRVDSAEVLPGVGSFVQRVNGSRLRYVFRGSPLVTLLWLEYSLYQLVEKLRPQCVVLDVSHGINYVPLLALLAARWALRAYSALSGNDVSLAVVNSDPVSEEWIESMIFPVAVWRIESEPLRILEYYRGLIGEKPYRVIDLEEVKKAPNILDEVKELERALSRVDSVLGDVASAASKTRTHGTVLAAVTLLLELDKGVLTDLIRRINELLEGLRDRRVKIVNDTIYVENLYVIDPPRVLNTLYALDAVKSLLDDLGKLYATSETVLRHGEYLMLSTDVLKGFAKRLGLRDVAETILKNELHDISEKIESFTKTTGTSIDTPTPYRVIHDGVERVERGREEKRIEECNPNERNFYAHAGLEKNTIAVMKRDNKVYIGYHPSCLPAVRRLITRKGPD